jgi:LPXTG-site transpeptidase (sortase) family protein
MSAIALGGLLLAASAGTLAYAEWAQWEHRAQQPPGPGEVLPPRLDARELPDPLYAAGAPESAVTPTPLRTKTPIPDEVSLTPSVQPTPYRPPGRVSAPDAPPPATQAPLPLAPTPRPADSIRAGAPARGLGRPVWMAIPSIGVDAGVTHVGIQDGAYQVPPWDVGHHADSGEPGVPGNSVYTGHVETLSVGHVFARLQDLQAGDAVYVYTPTQRQTWVVTQVKAVPNTDNRFVLPTADTRITLYTCTGRWDPLAHDYTERLVVVGRLVETTARG